MVTVARKLRNSLMLADIVSPVLGGGPRLKVDFAMNIGCVAAKGFGVYYRCDQMGNHPLHGRAGWHRSTTC